MHLYILQWVKMEMQWRSGASFVDRDKSQDVFLHLVANDEQYTNCAWFYVTRQFIYLLFIIFFIFLFSSDYVHEYWNP